MRHSCAGACIAKKEHHPLDLIRQSVVLFFIVGLRRKRRCQHIFFELNYIEANKYAREIFYEQ